MPANLPPQYLKAEEEYRRAGSAADRLESLRTLFVLLPKHKGTEKLQSDLKKKISQARDDADAAKSGGKKAGVSHRVPREGAGQVVLVGPPNSGESSLLAAWTNAKPTIAAYPYTTRVPQPGMATHGDVRIQIVDLPPVSPDQFEPWMGGVVRSADAALLVADLGDDDLIDATEAALARLADAHAHLVGEVPEDSGGEADIHVPAGVVANKSDAEGAADRLDLLREWLGGRFPVVAASTKIGDGLADGLGLSYDLLGVMRIFTKLPGKPADRSNPFTIPRGGSVLDLAREVHRDLEKSLKSARVWGSGTFDGQTVSRDHELRDGDIVELHA